MSLVNLSQEYVGRGAASLFRRLGRVFHPDSYSAGSLSEMSEGFARSPPRKGRADVVLSDLEVRSVDPNFVYEDVSLWGMDEGFCLPYFYLSDGSRTKVAVWKGGDSEKFLSVMKDFGLVEDDDSLDSQEVTGDVAVTVPKVYVRYTHDVDGGHLAIAGFSH